MQTLLKSYTTGLNILAYSTKYNDSILSATLAGMQVTALQLARISDDEDVVLKLWAAQTALWQLARVHVSNDRVDEKTRQRLQMLPRLAESLAIKYKDKSAEACILYVETLKQQSKYQDIVDNLQKENGDTLTRQQRLELFANAHEKLEQWEAAKGVYEMLLQDHPDQWAYWKSVLRNAYRVGGMEVATETIQSQLGKLPAPDRPCRARHLILCELKAIKICGLDEDSSVSASKESLEALQAAIVDYGNVFAPRASCAYSDLALYIEILVKASKNDTVDSFLEWPNQMRKENRNATDRSMLRSSIFAIQVTYKVLSMLKDKVNEKWLPDWEELVRDWRASQELGAAKEGEDVRSFVSVVFSVFLTSSQCWLTHAFHVCNS